VFRNFIEAEKHVLNLGIKKKIALCGAHDDAALAAVVDAKRKGVAEGILIGDEPEIKNILTSLDEPANDYEIIHEPDETKSAEKALKLINQGQADLPMKGIVQTKSYMSALLNREYGLRMPNRMITHATAFYYPGRDSMIFMSDTALIMNPALDEKVQIINNVVTLARAFGYNDVKVGVLSAVEVVNEKIPSTVDAQALSEMDWEDGVIVEGPFALDNALDIESAKHKGIAKQVAGNANVLLLPDFLTGNVLYKSIHYLARLPLAGAVCGTKVPAILTSRSDTPETKYYSILSAILQSL